MYLRILAVPLLFYFLKDNFLEISETDMEFVFSTLTFTMKLLKFIKVLISRQMIIEEHWELQSVICYADIFKLYVFIDTPFSLVTHYVNIWLDLFSCYLWTFIMNVPSVRKLVHSVTFLNFVTFRHLDILVFAMKCLLS